ncbi:UNVERIFIED_ORG: putative phosphodiesterase [Methylobacterium sp. SuP10 SLI 274]|uniref:metallophosphoesterase n=1 Tax=Methylorubrum extorquens TaxID=408 RepID=UPI00209EFF34|nr:metallophosphoesterase [Methylorubrum extorquens]MDF9865239.1 putative phosphodiesterase [Methylorubrum pseudosasae]MDH6638808.1 putative phosphodiesterase [Methylobacterium sp. SuP10 SLI 274]MDH6667995.1 putative phosphodiesterase [Methylorubrum zatmanii]MCP1559888.1 putative phosphodiesterase [Methylorubrum extorquens]MDF9793533.1 putative phosphodiesterase [Methylorubrum extorquens]
MLSRRSVLAASAALLAARAGAADGPLRFGVIADPQYAEAPPNPTLGRYYANSLDKMRAAVAALNGEDLRFVVTLGDIIDRDVASYDRILPIYQTLRHETRFLLGNHDFAVAPEHRGRVPGLLGMEGSYYDFVVAGIRFVVLDGNDVSLFAPLPGDPRRTLAAERLEQAKAAGLINAKPWNGSLSESQFAWLERRLAAARTAGERVVVLNHYPIAPDNPHNLWDAGRLTSLLAGQPHVIAYFNGHNHAGNYAERDGIHYVNFHGMVDTPDSSAFAVVEIAGDRLEIRGFGREPSRSLTLKTA